MFDKLAERARNAGGFTYRLCDATHPTSGWAVSVPGFEVKLAPGQPLTEAVLLDYVRRHLSALSRHCLGAWKDGDQWYLDVTQVVKTRGLAERLGRQYNQLAVYCLDTGETVRLDAKENNHEDTAGTGYAVAG